MPNPQQPEIARSRRSNVTAEAQPPIASTLVDERAGGPIPADNLPGHHPPVEQDKPTGPPPTPISARRKDVDNTFGFAFSRRLLPLGLPFGVTPLTASLRIDDGELHVRFGPWSIATPLGNVETAERTGPYSWWKVAGPPHISFADGGLTFATSTDGGVCLKFREPVKARFLGRVDVPVLEHQSLTVTVERGTELVDLVRDLGARATKRKG